MMRFFFMIMCHNVFNVWPKTTLLPVWPRDAKRLDIPGNLKGNFLREEEVTLVLSSFLLGMLT